MESPFERRIHSIKQTGEKVGEGADKEVYVHPDKSDRVVGIHNEDAFNTLWSDGEEEGKAVFFLNKIMHALFPKNTPANYMVTSEPSTIEKERVFGKPITEEDVRSEEFQQLREAFQEAGVILDYAKLENFIRDSEGHIVYVDDFDSYKFEYDPNKLKVAIEARLSGAEKESALRYLKRAEFFGAVDEQ